MIKSWNYKGLKAFFFTGSKAGIRPDHIPRLRRQLARLDEAESPRDMNVPGWRCHALEGRLDGHHAIVVNGNWRLTSRSKAATRSWSTITTITEARAR